MGLGLDFANIWDGILVLAIVFLVIAALGSILALIQGAVREGKWIGGIFVSLFAVFLLVSVFGATFAPVSTACTPGTAGCPVTPAPTGASAISSVVTGSLQGCVSFNSQSNTFTVPLVWNTTGKYFACGTSVGFTGSMPKYVVLWFSLARADTLNSTYGFTGVTNGIYTLTNSTTSIAYSPIGYTAATSSANGQWLIKWNAGSTSGAYPSQNAPSVTSGVGSTLVGVPAFGSKTMAYSFCLAGSNSTSGNFYYSATTFASYSFNIAFGGGSGVTPTQYTVATTVIGSHA